MVALKDERSIFFWRLAPHATPSEASVDVTLQQILDHLQVAFNTKKAFAHIDELGRLVELGQATEAKNCIYIADFHYSDATKSITILLNRGDPEASHPSFINPLKSTVVSVSPGDNEVQGWSAHLVISLVKDSTQRHRACFEKMPNVSSTLVQRYLEALIDQTTSDNPNYYYEKRLKTKKKSVLEKRPYKLRLGINKAPSRTLEQDMNEGILSSIILIRTKADYRGPGDHTILKTVKEQIIVRVKDVDASQRMAFVRNIFTWGKEQNYDQIQFKIEKLPGNQSTSPRFNLELSDALDTLYVRSERLSGFDKFLETCYETIDEEIASRMLAEINNEANW